MNDLFDFWFETETIDSLGRGNAGYFLEGGGGVHEIHLNAIISPGSSHNLKNCLKAFCQLS